VRLCVVAASLITQLSEQTSTRHDPFIIAARHAATNEHEPTVCHPSTVLPSNKNRSNIIALLTYEVLILKLQFIHSVNGDGSKTAKIIKKVILPTITLPECHRDAE